MSIVARVVFSLASLFERTAKKVERKSGSENPFPIEDKIEFSPTMFFRQIAKYAQRRSYACHTRKVINEDLTQAIGYDRIGWVATHAND